LPIDFLAKVLELSVGYQAIFYSMYVEELSNKKLVANPFGLWFDSFEKELKSVIDD
jgi:hypothetical protein